MFSLSLHLAAGPTFWDSTL